jgi:hypothetical protein
MPVQSVDLQQAVECDAIALLDGERVIGRLQLEIRTLAAGLRMKPAFEVERVRVSGQAVGEPPEPRT